MNRQRISIVKGQNRHLGATILPEDVQNKQVIWTIINQSDENIISVDQNGMVTANNIGSATVRATSKGNPARYADCIVSVGDENTEVIDSVNVVNLTELKVFLKNDPHTNPTSNSVNITRTINGTADNTFTWSGENFTWDSDKKIISIILPFECGAEYSVTDKEDATALEIESYTQRDYSSMEVVFSLCNGYATSADFVVKRLVNNEIETIWNNGGASSWNDSNLTCTMNYFNFGHSYPANSTIQYKVSYKGGPEIVYYH